MLTEQREVALEAQIGAAPSFDETALIRAAQKGDHDAFERLVRAHDQGVLRCAMNLLRSPEDARDVYQEAFLRVYKSLPGFRFDSSFHTWLYRVVTNLCLDRLRRKKVRREDDSVDPLESAREVRAEGDPERALLSRELSARIQEALQGLTPRERTVFELRHYQGMRLKAIGETLGTSEEAAKNCLFRVTQKMRAALGDFV